MVVGGADDEARKSKKVKIKCSGCSDDEKRFTNTIKWIERNSLQNVA